MQFIQESLGSQLYYLGYANYNENPTGFFDFAEHSPENSAMHYKFRTDNPQAVKKLISPEGRANKYYTHNVDGAFDIFD